MSDDVFGIGSLYTNEVKSFIHTRPWPKGLVMDVIEYETYLGLRFYRDNFATMDFDSQLQVTSIVKEVMEKVRGLGIPCFLEKEESVNG